MRRLIVQDRFDYQQVLKEAGKAMITILDRDKLLKYLVDSIKTGLSIERVCLFLGDSDGQFRMRQSADKLSEVCGDGIIDSFVVHCAKQDGILVREELAERSAGEDVVRLSRWMQTAGAEIIIPLLFKGELQGLLALGRRADAELFGASDLEILEMLANHAAIAIENARLYDEALHAKESLRESDEKFRTLAHTMPAAIFIHRGGKFLYANSVAEAMTGYTNEEFLSMEFWGLVHPDYLSMVQERGLSRLQNDAFPPQYEFKIIRKDREERWALMTASRMEYEGSPAVIGTLFDVTERKALEGQLRYAQKMEAIGKLAGGVAHDFNNVLTAIVGYANVLQARLGKDDTLRGFVDNILAATERAANMTQSLLAFGKKQSVTMSNADLNELVLRMKKLLSGLLHSGTELIIQSADCALPVLADGSQIERIIMNLLVNARDAMPRGGTVTIATSTAELGHDFIRKFGYGKAGPYALVSVSDTGIGMDEEVRGRIFEPFFTTKGLEKGTGFGLSIVYDIVKDHQGYITVDSEIGKGTTFTVYLPLQAVATERPVQKPVVREVRGTETILVVENEEEVREVVKAVLQAYGYTVIEAGDGEEAVEKFIRHKSAVHLLILDVIMPKMNGFEAYQAIRKKQPTIRALFTSGYSETVVQTKGLLEQGHLFIEKPFSPKELLSRVRQALDATPPRSSSLSPLSSRVGN